MFHFEYSTATWPINKDNQAIFHRLNSPEPPLYTALAANICTRKSIRKMLAERNARQDLLLPQFFNMFGAGQFFRHRLATEQFVYLLLAEK